MYVKYVPPLSILICIVLYYLGLCSILIYVMSTVVLSVAIALPLPTSCYYSPLTDIQLFSDDIN